MTDKVQKIREKVEKISKSINPYIPDEEGKNSEYEAGRFAMVTQIMQIIDSTQEEPKKCMYSKDNFTDEDRKVLCDGCEKECEYAHKKEYDVCKFCNEKNTCVDPCCVKLVEKQEPITDINFEQELYKAFGQVNDFTLGIQIAKRFYEMGIQHQEPVSEDLEQVIDNYLATYWGGEKERPDWPFLKKMAIYFAEWQKTKDESTTEDLGDYINKLSKRFPEVSFAKLSRIAVRVAKWQKEQVAKKAGDWVDANIEKYISADGEYNVDWSITDDLEKHLNVE